MTEARPGSAGLGDAAVAAPLIPARQSIFMMPAVLLDWFIPDEIRSRRTDRALARAFIFTHLFGPLIVQPIWVYLYFISPRVDATLVILAVAISSFWLLAPLLRLTGNMWLATLISFQTLAMTSLFGSYHYGGFSSPFLPWLVVSLLLGLFYHSKDLWLVLGIFAVDIAVFLGFMAFEPRADAIPLDQLATLGWLSMGSATIYMTWMALYYSAVVSLRTDLEREARRSQAVAQELEQARIVADEHGKARSRFFAKMSHELRTPLNSIIGYSEILLEELDDEPQSDPSRSLDVTRINVAGKHLLSLVSEVLDGNAIESETTHLHPATITLGALCDGAVASALPLIERNGNRLTVRCPQPDRLITTDSKKLRQVIINLLGNAGKFTSDGEVTLQVDVDEGLHDDHLRIIVSDTGIGIPKDMIETVFNDYQQGDPSVVTRFGGTGLGLAVSRQFCLLLGGHISAKSEPGHGAIFTVMVPASLSADDEAGSTSVFRAGAGTLKTLNRQAMSQLLLLF